MTRASLFRPSLGDFVLLPTSVGSTEKAPAGPHFPAGCLPAAAKDACQKVQFGAELLAKSKKTTAPGTVNGSTRICVLVGRQYWEAPEDGSVCRNRRHAHMTLGRVEALMAEGKMEMVRGVITLADGTEEAAWIPVARFVNARRWTPKLSKGEGAPMMTLQLVPGG